MEEDTGTLATLQQNHYYPFGMLIPSLSTTNTLGALKDNRYLYNGKEFQNDFELDWYDYGARFYDAQIARWHSVDPLAEKYYPISPYAYVANNPIMFIDPDGREIWLYQYDDEGNRIAELQYTPGMEYDGDNAYFSNAIGSLNQMNSVEIGSSVLNVLHGSDNIFGVSNQTSPVEGTKVFEENKNGGGMLKMGESFSLETLAHEMFHGYQHEMGQGRTSIFNEVEAILFGQAVAMQVWFDSEGKIDPPPGATITGLQNTAGRIYHNSIISLLFRPKFSIHEFTKAVVNFREGAHVYQTGVYDLYPIHRNQRKSLINDFYPLIRQ